MNHTMISRLLAFLLPIGLMRFNVDGGDGGGGGTGGTGLKKEPETFSREYVQELRAENKGLRLKNTELTGKIDGFEKEKADAVSKAVEEATVKIKADAKTEASAEADKRVLMAELKGEAVKAGLVDLDQLKLLDVASIKLTADGKIEGADALFTGLKTSKPYLFGVPNTSSNTQQKTPPANTDAKKVTEMDATEYAAAKAALLK